MLRRGLHPLPYSCITLVRPNCSISKFRGLTPCHHLQMASPVSGSSLRTSFKKAVQRGKSLLGSPSSAEKRKGKRPIKDLRVESRRPQTEELLAELGITNFEGFQDLVVGVLESVGNRKGDMEETKRITEFLDKYQAKY